MVEVMGHATDETAKGIHSLRGFQAGERRLQVVLGAAPFDPEQREQRQGEESSTTPMVLTFTALRMISKDASSALASSPTPVARACHQHRAGR
ncbi:hypothetical protein ACFQU7_32320 [Pseudoroseomonas wenyumeiae]